MLIVTEIIFLKEVVPDNLFFLICSDDYRGYRCCRSHKQKAR